MQARGRAKRGRAGERRIGTGSARGTENEVTTAIANAATNAAASTIAMTERAGGSTNGGKGIVGMSGHGDVIAVAVGIVTATAIAKGGETSVRGECSSTAQLTPALGVALRPTGEDGKRPKLLPGQHHGARRI